MRFVNLRSIACPPHRTKRNEGAVKRRAETATIGGSRHFHARPDVCPRAFCTHACAAEAASAPMRGRDNQHSIRRHGPRDSRATAPAEPTRYYRVELFKAVTRLKYWATLRPD